MSPLEWREAQRLSQDTVARLLGLSGKNPARTWQRWEAGIRQPPLTVIAKLELLSDGRVNTSSWIKIRVRPDRSPPATGRDEVLTGEQAA